MCFFLFGFFFLSFVVVVVVVVSLRERSYNCPSRTVPSISPLYYSLAVTMHDLLFVSWYSEPSQPQRTTSRLKRSICLLFTLHASHLTANYPKNTKSVLSQTHIKQKIHKHQTQNFQGISPFGIAPVKKINK